MYGASIGTLRLVPEDGSYGSVVAWSMSGDQGDVWHYASVAVYATAFRFEYIRGSGPRGDAAVADVGLACGARPPAPPSAPPLPPGYQVHVFDFGTGSNPGWSTVNGTYSFVRHSGVTPSSDTGPSAG
eukprot:1970660-Prymnesium_polylepis.1